MTILRRPLIFEPASSAADVAEEAVAERDRLGFEIALFERDAMRHAAVTDGADAAELVERLRLHYYTARGELRGGRPAGLVFDMDGS